MSDIIPLPFCTACKYYDCINKHCNKFNFSTENISMCANYKAFKEEKELKECKYKDTPCTFARDNGQCAYVGKCGADECFQEKIKNEKNLIISHPCVGCKWEAHSGKDPITFFCRKKKVYVDINEGIELSCFEHVETSIPPEGERCEDCYYYDKKQRCNKHDCYTNPYSNCKDHIKKPKTYCGGCKNWVGGKCRISGAEISGQYESCDNFEDRIRKVCSCCKNYDPKGHCMVYDVTKAPYQDSEDCEGFEYITDIPYYTIPLSARLCNTCKYLKDENCEVRGTKPRVVTKCQDYRDINSTSNCKDYIKKPKAYCGSCKNWISGQSDSCPSFEDRACKVCAEGHCNIKNITIAPYKDASDCLDFVAKIKIPPRDQSVKADAGKPMLSLVPPELIEGVGKVLTFGAAKYSPNSWRNVEIERYRDALMRHLCAYLGDPQGLDEESGLMHIEHLACNVAFLIAMEYKVRDIKVNDAKNVENMLNTIKTMINDAGGK